MKTGRDASIPLWVLGRFHELIPLSLRPVQFHVIQSLDELLASAQLVYREYLAKQYVSPAAAQMKLSIYHALPQTTTCVARHRQGSIIGTVTVMEDSPLGLPMDDAYKVELDSLRQRGRRLAEVAWLTVESRLFCRGTFAMTDGAKLLLLMRLLKVLLDYVRSSTEINELVACFHPKHQLLFDYFGLAPLGGPKTYPGTGGTLTVARHLDLDEAPQAMSHPTTRFFYGTKPSPKPFARKLIYSPEELRRLFVLDSSVFASVSPTELRYFRSC